MSELWQLNFKTLSRLAYALLGLDTIPNLSAVQLSGLPDNDPPVTHTVTLRLARSFAFARWRHSISSPRVIQRTSCPRLLLAA
jgi:hypothetical protein